VHEFNIERINDSIWVFKNAIKNSKDMVEHFNKTKEWTDWYTFGKIADGPSFKDLNFDTFPTEEQWEDHKLHKDSETNQTHYFENQISSLFYYITKLYAEEKNIILDNWAEDGWNIAKYVPNIEKHKDYVMMHHTDYQREFAYNPGLKFAITTVFYLNDDYEGGEILFRILDEDNPLSIKEEYSYKPSEGDVLVFPSGPPNYHGVKAVTSGEKYIIRNYWRYEYSGHPLWLKLQEKYGEDIWRQLEEQRLKFNRDSKNVEIVNNIPFWVEFEEYYKKEIGALKL
jgi:hypothetical protein